MNMDIGEVVSKTGVLPVLGAREVTGRDRRNGLNVVIAQTSRSRLDAMQILDIKSGASGELSVSRLVRRQPRLGVTDPLSKRDAYSICLHLSDFSGFRTWCDGRSVTSSPMTAGSVQIADLRHEWSADIQSSFDVVNFGIPQSMFDEMSDDEGAPRAVELKCSMSDARPDPVLVNLARALLPALAAPHQANTLFADYAARAVTAYIARTYGVAPARIRDGKGGLTPWQERRAKDMLHANLSGQITLADLAGACRLSCSQFSQAFRQSVGCPPHRWQLVQRVERAKYLILNSSLPLSEIALETGFSDQSHFTRVFSRTVKTSPAAWRREQSR